MISMGCCFNPASEDIGSLKFRRCTDVFWLTAYIGLWIFMVLIAAFAFVYGNPMRLVHGYDSFGNTCGSSRNEKIENLILSGLDLSKKPFVFFMDVKSIKTSLQICVESCPDTQINNIEQLRAFYFQTGTNLCRYDYNVSEKNNEDIAHGLDESLILSSPLGPCPTFPVYKSMPVLNRCTPRELNKSAFLLFESLDTVDEFLFDLYSTWLHISGLCLQALVISLALILSFHLIPRYIGTVILMCVSVFAIVGTVFLWWTYFTMETNSNSPLFFLEQNIVSKEAFLAYSITATIITIALLLLVFFLRCQVSYLVTLLEESRECIRALPSLYAAPVFSFVLLILFYAFWISVIVYLASSRYPGTEEIRPFFLSDINTTPENNNFSNKFHNMNMLPRIENISVHSIKTFTRIEFVEGPWIRYMWWVYFLGLVWVSEFILTCQQMVIAGAVAEWYFEGKNEQLRQQPVWKSIRTVMYYHLGSVALGSLLIFLFKVPRLILKFFVERYGHSENNSVSAKCGMKTCYCCTFCFEKFIRYINHNAYTVVAMQGINFCPAASRAWTVLAHNPLEVASYNIVGDIILFLAKALITTVTGLVAVVVFKYQLNIYFYAAPTLLVCIFAFFISHCVISVYEMIIDTLFLCLCEDKDINEDEGIWRNSALVRSSSAAEALINVNPSGSS